MSRHLNRFPYHVQTLKPTIRRGFITNTTPYPFLKIQPGLITRQILHMKPLMSLKEKLNCFATMPSGSIHIQQNPIPFEPPVEVFQTAHKSLSVPLRPSHKPAPTKTRGYPPEDIQPLAMLARGRYLEPLSFSCPPHPYTGMEGEARFILKHDRFPGTQDLQFFLKSDETASHPLFAPEDTNNSPVSAGILIDASMLGPGEPSALSRTAASGVPPAWDRPIAPDSARTPKGTFPSVLVMFDVSLGSNEPDDQVSWGVRMPSTPVRSPCASTRSASGATSQGFRKSTLDADLPTSAAGLLPLFRYMLSDSGE
jgi:hypothetical protein